MSTPTKNLPNNIKEALNIIKDKHRDKTYEGDEIFEDIGEVMKLVDNSGDLAAVNIEILNILFN